VFNQRRRSGIRRLLGVVPQQPYPLLVVGASSLTIERAGLGEVATQAPDAKPLVQQGLERYQNGNFQGQSVLANSLEHLPIPTVALGCGDGF